MNVRICALACTYLLFMHVRIYLEIRASHTYTALVLYVSISSTKMHLSIDLLSLMGAYVDMHVKIYVKLHITRC